MIRFFKYLKYFGLILFLLFIFRGFIYRKTINYSTINSRENITITNKKLIKEINKHIKQRDLSLEQIINISSKITQDNLSFTFNKVSSNPNITFDLKKSNCVGYAALFNAIGNYILIKQDLNKNYKFNHLIGELVFFGLNSNDVFKSSFFKNHDFNEVVNSKTGKSFFIDPSLQDYFKIRNVTSK